MKKVSPSCRIFSSFLLSFFLTSCSLFFDSEEEPIPQTKDIELLLSRGSLTGTDFEHFKYTNNTLFVECGSVERGRFSPRQQNIVKLMGTQRDSIFLIANEFLLTNKEKKWSWDKPGNSISLTDPGELNLDIKADAGTAKIYTSLDSIGDPRNSVQRYLNKLVRTLRNVTLQNAGHEKGLCGNHEFYGLGFLR